MAPAAIDPETMARLYSASGVSATPPPTNWSEYSERLIEWIATLLFQSSDTEGSVASLGRFTFLAAEFLVLALAVFGVTLLLRAFRQSSIVLALSDATLPAKDDGPPARPDLDARARLEEQDLRGALAAAWWWFGGKALGRSPNPGMTTVDVLRMANREDLRSIGRDLDRLRFSPAPPEASAVSALLLRLSGL